MGLDDREPNEEVTWAGVIGTVELLYKCEPPSFVLEEGQLNVNPINFDSKITFLRKHPVQYPFNTLLRDLSKALAVFEAQPLHHGLSDDLNTVKSPINRR